MSNAERTTDISASLEEVLSTQELNTRPSRPPNYEIESRALRTLAQHMADSPQTILQKLVEIAVEICRAGSGRRQPTFRKDRRLLLASDSRRMEPAYRRRNTTQFWSLRRRT